MVLDWLTLLYTDTAGASLNASQPMAGQLIWLVLEGVLVWRIWPRGRLAWTVLPALTGLLLILEPRRPQPRLTDPPGQPAPAPTGAWRSGILFSIA